MIVEFSDFEFISLHSRADISNMEVFTYVGRRASALSFRTDGDIKYSKSSALRSASRESVRPFSELKKDLSQACQVPLGFSSGWSPRSAYVPPRSREPVRNSPSAARLSVQSIAFAFCSLAIFSVVPFLVFNFLDRKVDSLDFSRFFSFSESGSGDAIVSFADTSLDSVIPVAMERFALVKPQTEAVFDSNGNILLSDGTVLSSASVVFSEPVTFSTYTVKSGDTIGSITYGSGLRNISTLIAVNGIKNVRTIRAGQKLRIPSQDGLVHIVAAGDSLNALSVKYHVSVEELLDTNDLSGDVLTKGMELFIPGAKMDYTALKSAMGELFSYPLQSGCWRLTSLFGKRKDPITGAPSSHTGIDMAAPKGTTIKAAMSGKVVKAMYSPVYGNYIIIDHGNGYQTLYGHMTKYVVSRGQYVEQGQRVGYVGSTGYSTGPHLHFTVYKDGRLVDPLSLLK